MTRRLILASFLAAGLASMAGCDTKTEEGASASTLGSDDDSGLNQDSENLASDTVAETDATSDDIIDAESVNITDDTSEDPVKTTGESSVS